MLLWDELKIPLVAPPTSGIITGGSDHEGVLPPRIVVFSECRRACLWSGMPCPPHFLETAHKENLYGSSKSTFAAGVFGPAPIPTLRLSLVDCEI